MENLQVEVQTNVIINIEEQFFHPRSFQEAEKSLSFEQKGRDCVLGSDDYKAYLIWKI
jgi:hypothetical protein